jgi:hypothetical protein
LQIWRPNIVSRRVGGLALFSFSYNTMENVHILLDVVFLEERAEIALPHNVGFRFWIYRHKDAPIPRSRCNPKQFYKLPVRHSCPLQRTEGSILQIVRICIPINHRYISSRASLAERTSTYALSAVRQAEEQNGNVSSGDFLFLSLAWPWWTERDAKHVGATTAQPEMPETNETCTATQDYLPTAGF